jgi:hypothetical protein
LAWKTASLHINGEGDRRILCAMSADRPRFPPSMHLETNAGKTWRKSDLLFLIDALERGMSFVELAGFSRRREDEVREKARELRGHFPPRTPASDD